MLTLYPFLSVLSISCIYIFLLLDTPSIFLFFLQTLLLSHPPQWHACHRDIHIFQPVVSNLNVSNMTSRIFHETWCNNELKKHGPNSAVKNFQMTQMFEVIGSVNRTTWPPPQVLPKYQIVSRILEFNPRPEAVWCQQSSTFNIRENSGSVRKCKAGWSLHSKTAV